MSIFGESKEVSVGSVAYNMAGPEENRPNYLQSLVVGNVLSHTKDSLGDTFRAGYLNGPAIKFRNFYKWADNPLNFDLIGMPSGNLLVNTTINKIIVQDEITVSVGYSSWVQRATLGMADYGLWVEQWLLENYPAEVGNAWTADIDDDATLITITFADTSVHTFAPADFEHGERYIYAWYTPVTGETTTSLVTGSTISLGVADFPSTSGWDYEGESTVGLITHWTYSRLTYVGPHASGSEYLREYMHLYEEAGMPIDREYRIDYQTYYGLAHQQVKLFIYKIGSGNAALDAAVIPVESFGQFFPFLPVRINNTFISESYLPDVYAQVKKAYKKATGSSFDKYIVKLEDNDDLNDIDYAYITFGVSLNTKEN
jgi:hypothetical protein